MIDTYGAATVLRVADEAVPEPHGKITISTAHKAKGREWNRVKIAPDFKEPAPQDDGTDGELNRSEMMLAYVSVTRAQLVLDPTGLKWVDHFIAKQQAQEDNDGDTTPDE
jgi:superfamily I DNA/RNA helicase